MLVEGKPDQSWRRGELVSSALGDLCLQCYVTGLRAMLCRGFYASLVRSHIAYSMQWSFKIRPSCVAGVGPKLQGSRIILTPPLMYLGLQVPPPSPIYVRVKF